MNDKHVIKENGNGILRQDKYYYILVIGNKTSLLSSDNSKSTAKDKAIETLKNKSNDINSFNNKIIYRVTIRKVTKEEKEEEAKSVAISYVGGPLVSIIENVKVLIDSNNKIKYKNLGECGNSKVFLDKKYLKKYNFVDIKNIRKLVYAYDKSITNCAFAVNTISDILKKV